MTEMIRTTSGDYIPPLDYVQRRRGRAPAPPVRTFAATGAFAPGADVRGPMAGQD